MSTRHFLTSTALAVSLVFAAAPPPAEAQVTVIDPSAIVQAVKQVEQGLQQIQALQAQLTNQAAMLQKLGTDVTGPLAQITSQATGLLQQAQGLGYSGQSIAQQFQSLYPTNMSGSSFASLQSALAGWRTNSNQALQEAMATQNQIVQAQPTTANAVTSAVAASQGAAGQTAAIQATNQLLATVSSQLTQLQALLITEARAAQTAQAQNAAIQAAGAAESERFWATTPPASRVQNPDKL
jgi:P-type conjugative transfer protein TrbJ